MKSVLTDIFQRTLAPLTGESHACLRLDNVTPVEDQQTLKAPAATALIVGLATINTTRCAFLPHPRFA